MKFTDALASRGGEIAVCIFMILVGIGLSCLQPAAGASMIATFSGALGVLLRNGGGQ